MKKTIIALSGPKGVGKTTTARRLLMNPQLPKPAGILSFAAPIKDMLRPILPKEAFTAEGKDDPKYGINGVTPRKMMQDLGRWLKNELGETALNDIIRKKIEESDLEAIIIDDFRMEVEASIIKDLGGVIVVLERSGINYTCEHETEFPLPCHLIDQTLNIDGLPIELLTLDLDELNSQVDSWVPTETKHEKNTPYCHQS